MRMTFQKCVLAFLCSLMVTWCYWCLTTNILPKDLFSHNLNNGGRFFEFINYIEDDVYLPIPRNIVRDNSNPLDKCTNQELVQRFRFSRDIMPMIYPIERINDNHDIPIPEQLKLCIALRYFATGSYQRVSGDIVEVSQSSVCRIISEVSNLLVQNLHRYIKYPRDNNAFRVIKQAFYNIAHFLGVIGCVDGTHVEIKNPGGPNAEAYSNRKGWMSLNIQVVAGPRCEILDIVIRWPGSAHDSRIFNSSSEHMRLQDGRLPGTLLDDSAYSQTNNVYTPLLEPRTIPEQRYNAAHIRTRNAVERTFGIWKGRFRCLTNALQLKLANTTKVIGATAVLHNIAIKHRQHFCEQDFVHDNHILHVVDANNIRGIAIRNAFIQRHFSNC